MNTQVSRLADAVISRTAPTTAVPNGALSDNPLSRNSARPNPSSSEPEFQTRQSGTHPNEIENTGR